MRFTTGGFPCPPPTFLSCRKTQSYNPCGERRSFKLVRLPTLRQYSPTTASADIFKCLARRSISSSLIQTYPGAPVQQFPHCVQVNSSPSAYQVSVCTTLSFTTSVSRLGKIKFLQVQL